MSTATPEKSSAAPKRGPLDRVRREFDSLLGSFGEEFEALFRSLTPVDLYETDEAVEVQVDLPGVKPDDVEIRLSGLVLTVRGERKIEKHPHLSAEHRTERRTGAFSRSVTLPCEVMEDEAVAEYRDGVLTITLPKAETSRAHRIAIKAT